MQHRAVLVTDLLFGDSGKGTIVDSLTRSLAEQRTTVWNVRHCGGAQAAHAVVTPEGKHHVFHQFGSGTFVPGVRTYLGPRMLVNPLLLFWENEDLEKNGVRDALSRLILDPRALVTTPYHSAANRLRELARGKGIHGSCGLGIGETAAFALDHPRLALRVRDLTDPARLRRKLDRLRATLAATLPPCTSERMEAEAAVFTDDGERDAWIELTQYLLGTLTLADESTLPAHLADPRAATVFEGSQGVLLDEWRGFHPYTTWSSVTTRNAYALLRRTSAAVTSLGVIRGYATRHGAGPFPTEDAALTAALPDDTNPENPWQGRLRVGWPDLPLLRYSRAVAGKLDGLVVTCLDRMVGHDWQVAADYATGPLRPGPFRDLGYQENLTATLGATTPCYQPWCGDPAVHAEHLAAALNLPLVARSWGKSATDKEWLTAL